MLDLLVKNALLVTSDHVLSGSVAVKNGKIAEILPADTDREAKTIIDGRGFYLFPGLIDSHVHLNDPGFEWREDFNHATEAAAVGGVTTVVDMPLQNDPALTNREIFQKKLRAVKDKSIIDYAFWAGVINDNLKELAELNECGVMAFKSFLAPVSSDFTSLDYGRVRKGLSIIKGFDGLAGFHCEDYGIVSYNEENSIRNGHVSRKDYLNARPVIAELVAVQTIIELARESGTRVHICHVSHPRVAEKIKQAKMQGVRITAETCPHYLVFNEDDFLSKGMFFKCAPPLRSKEASNMLWRYILDGTLDLVVSDHSPCADTEKSEAEGVFHAWGGISGIQTGLQVMFHEIVSKRKWSPTLISRLMARNPAHIFGMKGKKGELTLGYDADLVLVDPNASWEISADNLKYLNQSSAFIGYKGTGQPVCTILRGNVVAEDGIVKGKYGFGRFIKRGDQ